MFPFLGLVATIAAGAIGFILVRGFVKRRLRFVDAVYSPVAPVAAAVLAAVVAWPFAILPIITTTTAAIFGLGAGLGTASGVKALKRGEG